MAGVAMPPVIIADQQKRWGSCDRTGTIRLSYSIIQAPMRLVDYVVVHELVHLRHRGHGRDYWQAVGRVMSDFLRRRERFTATWRRVGVVARPLTLARFPAPTIASTAAHQSRQRGC